MGNTIQLAERTTEEIFQNLRDRRGIKHVLENIELDFPNVYKEIKEEIKQIIINNYENHVLY